MPSLYMPDVVVEIAFDSGYTTPAASRTWTDVSAYVELHQGINIGVGRQDELSTADANHLSLTLDNSDGRFTAFRAASPYYPNVKLGRPIRVTATPPGGTASTRFVGFVNEWPVEWDGTDAYARAAITASSRLSRLGLNSKLRSAIEQTILAADPARYWTLGESSGATTASESSGNSGAPLVMTGSGAAVVFGNATGPAGDGLTAAQFTGGQYLFTSEGLTDKFRGSYRAAVKLDALPGTHGAGVVTFGSVTETFKGFGITVSSTGLIQGLNTTGPSVNDGAFHDVVITFDADTGESLYVDGVLVDTGAPYNLEAVPANVAPSLTGVIAHAAFYDGYVLTADQVAEQAEAVLTAFEGERTDERLVRILGWAGVAATEVDAEVGSETMTYQLTLGMSVVDALREVEATEGGVLFDGPDGDVKFHNRARRYLATPVATLNMASQHVGSDYAPRLDRSTLANDVTVSNPTTEETARATDTASSDEYGVAAVPATSVADSYDPLQQKAAWLVASYAEPRPRVPSLTADVLAHQGLTPSAQTLLGVTVGDLLEVTNAPMQADSTDGSYFVEGYTERIGPESYAITFNLSPTYPTLDVLVLDDPDRGLLDIGLLGH